MRDSIKLNESETRAILERLALHDAASLDRAEREAKRLRLPSNMSIEIVLTHPGGGEVHVRAVVKDVSRTGMGILYGGFLHHGTRVLVRFIGDDRTALIVQAGKVNRCVHVQGPVHDVGIKFDAPVSVESLFGLVDDRAGECDPDAAAYAELDRLANDAHKLVRGRGGVDEIARAARALADAAERSGAPPKT
ncbi:MAG: PilZ domain-containing protein [Phycisphaerae bacterium]|nr:PilZ domain-containing protein [Phycisphaerae bacterium]